MRGISDWFWWYFWSLRFQVDADLAATGFTFLPCCGHCTHRGLRIYPDYSEETFKHILVPAWILNYDYGRSRHQVLINGYTGAIAGQYPKSAWKIFFLTLFIAGVIALLLFLVNQ